MNPLRDIPVIFPVSLCPKDLMNIHNASGKWWSQTHCINPHWISCTQIPYWSPPPEWGGKKKKILGSATILI